MLVAFACLPIAAVIRAVMPIVWPAQYQIWLWLAGGLWSLAFGMFVVNYAAILSKPRIDGRPG